MTAYLQSSIMEDAREACDFDRRRMKLYDDFNKERENTINGYLERLDHEPLSSIVGKVNTEGLDIEDIKMHLKRAARDSTRFEPW